MLKTGNNINVTGDKGQSVDMDKETEVNQFHLQLHFTAIDRETTKSLQLFHMGILTKYVMLVMFALLGVLVLRTTMNNILWKDRDIDVTVDTSSRINYVDRNYLGFTIDTSMFQPKVHFHGFNFSSPRVHTLMKALSPALLRIGGTSADWLFYNEPIEVIYPLKLLPSAHVMMWYDIQKLVELVRSTGNRLLFGLNLQVRFGTQWDPSNALELIKYCSRMGYCENIDWELGNEPNWYAPGRQNLTTLTPEQIGNDYLILKRLLSKYDNCRQSSIVGPDVGRPTSSLCGKILSGVANMAGSFIRALTFHHYYFAGGTATYKTYLNVSYFHDLAREISEAKLLVSKTKFPDIPIWLGETSDAYNSGTKNVSDRFVSGFLWMEKLGLSAAMGLKVVLRQTLYGGNYALLDVDLNPNPDYWLSWLHKKFVGQLVFAVTLSGISLPPSTRVYAHCTNTEGSSYDSGALTVFALNADESTTSVLRFTDTLSDQPVDLYLLEADGPDYVLSKWVKLNGLKLQMISDNLMPLIRPTRLQPGAVINLPPVTMAYLVFPYADVQLCRQ